MKSDNKVTVLVILMTIVIIWLAARADDKLEELRVECDQGSQAACVEYEVRLRNLTAPVPPAARP